MSYTTPFKTMTEIVPCINLPYKTTYPIALDIGYSAVKGFSPFSRFCFPSYAREQLGEIVGTPKSTDIYYRNESGTLYTVGALAQESLSTKDTNDASNTLFSRNRYFSPSFLILARVGMAISMKQNMLGAYPGEIPIFLQTGLPPAYRKADTPQLIEALSGHHKFELRIGHGEWQHFNFTLEPENISVIDQPIGSVYSASKRNNGDTVAAKNGKAYIDSRTLVLDGGFGTLDLFSIIGRRIDSSNTFNDLGMESVFSRTADDIFRCYGKELYVHTMQPCLETGVISVLDRKNMATKEYDISELLERNSAYVCNKALERIEVAYNNLEDFDFLIVTGGTGAAWMPYIQERYRRMTTLEIIGANQNDPISPVYNNVRGYYIYRALVSAKR